MAKPKPQQEVTIPINPQDVKISTEVMEREKPEIETVEYVTPSIVKGKKLTAKSAEKKVSKKTTRKSKAGNYTLIITEKPQAALKISSALGDARKYTEAGASYYELERDGEKIIVACAVGHLFTLVQKKGEKGWPVFNIEWLAVFKKNIWAKKYYNLLVKLVKQANEFIVATDYDIEGEVIGLNIIKFIAKQSDAKRMKFSSLTQKELEDAYNNASPTLAWGQAIAGETRHYLDWLYGINLSRALMDAIKAAGSFRIMSVGRVQGPALALIVEREREISKFKAEPYWQVFVIIDKIEFKYIKDLTKKSELIPFQHLQGKKAELETKKTTQEIRPPAPFDLTTLQTEAYKFHGINPARTLQIAQTLYLAGLISYPRTSSQKIPESINPYNIIKKLSKQFETKLCTRKIPVEGSKSDPAHPSIYPTGEFEMLDGEDKKIYDLIARRFLSCFCPDAIVENKTITAMVNELRFVAKGLQVAEKGWMEVYKQKLAEKELPDMSGSYTIDESRIEEKETQPPRRYSPASLVAELAKRNLGTKATRAAIIETLYNRGYIAEQSIRATPLGISLIETLEKHSPIIIDEKLTRKFEKEMDLIQTAKKELKEKQEKILDEAKKTITDISKNMRNEQMEIGKELVNANQILREEQKKNSEIIECPKCKKGKLRILYNKMSRRYFAGCSNYPECKNTFSLPPNALIKKSDKVCEKCNWPMLMSIKKAKRPWVFCFNPDCETNAEWAKKKAEKAAQSQSNQATDSDESESR